MGKQSVSVRYKSKEEKAKNPGADTTSRLTVPGPHSHPSTPKSRPKRCVETPGDPWDASQPPGSFHPAYGMPPTANRWLPPLSSSQREQSLSVQRCSQWELSPGATTRREEIPGVPALEVYPVPSHHPTTPTTNQPTNSKNIHQRSCTTYMLFRF